MKTLTVKAGGILIGGGNPIVVQTMCNTHTYDIEKTVSQCMAMEKAGAQMIRITVPGLSDVSNIRRIKEILLSRGIATPIVADIHFSSDTAIAVAPFVDKVRINPGNFHRDHREARNRFSILLDVCRRYGTAIRIGLNHGSLGEYITSLYGNTPLAMAKAAMEWINMCIDADFHNVVVSLKSSNTIVMVEAYRELVREMKEKKVIFPLHVGVTEAGNGDSGRIKSAVGISALLSEGIGDTIRVSLTEDPVNEIPVAKYLADRYDRKLFSSMTGFSVNGKTAVAQYSSPSRERLLLDASCDFGKRLLDKELDEVEFHGTYTGNDGKSVSVEESGFGKYLSDELLQAARRRFYKPEYIACPGCGRTMYDLQSAFDEVKKKTAHMKNVVIAVMGCIVNGPGEMADADWGYVGEGNHKVSIYHKNKPVARHIEDTEAVDRLLELIKEDQSRK
ncbi:MAG: (E)-4-hydroxy-3-methylbut-2-enyl-diphosphate synthase [Bacteroidales bacterium]|jgi:(E)-4-hydroxy-3-methylbut-2-enyl-diphosphate synthase|nr:(E)-4-hydroxy-3-methylbut-2-enyl-diphosphate synthase [Bacteroidales bacterium]MCI1786039.1 (E)-4-hydroxy-3-methylbut-2-enyl-diphosphate synthase [Bacteroidales bacterium]